VLLFCAHGSFWTLQRGALPRAEGAPVADGSGLGLRSGEAKLPATSAGSRHARDAPLDRGRSHSRLTELGLLWEGEHGFHPTVHLTVRQGVAALARRTWATSQPSPQLLANLEGWRASSPLVRPHHCLRLALVQPRERGGRLLAQRSGQRTPAMAAGRTNRRWTAGEVLSDP
jgi:hypothetical protein